MQFGSVKQSLCYKIIQGSIVNSFQIQYSDLVRYSASLLDSLLALHYLALLLLELRQAGPAQYLVRVVRSPDGESRR